MGASDLLSIVIRTHDRPVGMVADAARSALAQTGAGDYEVVVVHSGPDRRRIDDMLAGLDPGGRRARQVHAPEAAGNRAASCNAGARAARGEWIRYLDDDDLLAPAALSVYRRHISGGRRAPPSPIVWSDLYWEHVKQGRRRRRLVPRLNSAIARRARDRAEQVLFSHVGTATLFVRRSLLARHPYDGEYYAAEDAEWLWRTALVNGVAMDFLPVITTRARIHGGNTGDTLGAAGLAGLQRRAADRVDSAMRAGGRAAEADRFREVLRRRDRPGRVRARVRLTNACSRSRLATSLYLRYHGVRDAFGLA